MYSLDQLFSAFGKSRWWAVFLTVPMIVLLSIGSVVSFRASIGALAWLSAEQAWIRHREASVECVRNAIEDRDVTDLDDCEDPFDGLRKFDQLKDHVEAKHWERSRNTMLELELQPNEADAALVLFKLSRDIPLVGSAYEVWGAALQDFHNLEVLVSDFRSLMERGGIDKSEQRLLQRRLERTDQHLQDSERRFAELLGEAHRQAERVGLVLAFAALLLVIGLGIYLWRERTAVERQLAMQERTFLALVENLREAVPSIPTEGASSTPTPHSGS